MGNRRQSSRRAASARALSWLLATSCLTLGSAAAPPANAAPGANVTTYVSGLNNPRGLKFGPDGALYVAEGGLGGNTSTNGLCNQVPPPVGPYTGSHTSGRISRIGGNHVRTTVVDNLPSSQTSPALNSFVSGVADVAFVGGTLYGLLAGAGCSHGVTSLSNGVVRINPNHSWTLIADLSAYQKAHPVAQPFEVDFEPDGTWYSMIAVNGELYALEPNHGEVDKVTIGGAISRVIDISESQGHVVPTALAYHGNFYTANLGGFPQAIGSSKVWKFTPSGQIKGVESGFDMVLGLVFDNRARMYVLETAAQSPAPAPNKGRITRIDPGGARKIIADGLLFPTGMTLGPDGNLYVSNFGFGGGQGDGSVLKVELTD